jgi:AraC-like DNA-binding protein
MINTDEIIIEICFPFGFNKQTYFNRQFKAITGLSP